MQAGAAGAARAATLSRDDAPTVAAGRRLVIAYNAEAGLVAGAFDMVHKIVSPATYPCSLCGLTYGLAGMKREWRAFLDRTGLPVAFHHRPDFRAAFPQAAGWPLPVVALADGGGLEPLVGAAELAALPDLAALIDRVEARLAN